MNFYLGSSFLENVLAWRLLHIEGGLGKGKTLLSVALARWLYLNKFVDGVFSNVPIDPDYIPIRDTVRNSAVILDEGWSFADARNSNKKFEGYGAYARKFDSFWLSPSVFRIDKRMAHVRCRRSADIWLIDSWLYKWHDIEGNEGSFLFAGYKEVYGKYDHKAIPFDDGGILQSLMDEVARASRSTGNHIWVPDSKRVPVGVTNATATL